MKNLDMVLAKETLEREDLIELLSLNDPKDLEKLYNKAYEVKSRYVGNKVYFRGIVEFSNVCAKDCLYCGIRRSNKGVERYSMSVDEIVEAAMWAHSADYGSIVMQSGERMDEEFVSFVETALQQIKKESNGKLGITLSLGEQSYETYRRWFEAGAHRYLLRIETSRRDLYESLHPENHLFDERGRCLKDLRSLGYQVGTGVMIGLPGQGVEDLADDLLYFRDNDIDMIGMGPFIPHKDTPLAESLGNFDLRKEHQFELGLKMIACARILLKDVNIASTTALQALNSIGRELGIQAGANIVMPNITETKYRKGYQLYDNKPCLDENSSMCRGCLGRRISSVGESIGFNEWGDSPHFMKRKG